MKKLLITVAVLGVVALTLGAAGFAYAQYRTPTNPDYPHGPGMMGEDYGRGRGHMDSGFGHMMGWGGEVGPMHEEMVNQMAAALDLSVDEIESRLGEGETMWDIASAEGLSAEEIQDLMNTAHDAALQDAVDSGLLADEQAEWMDEHMEQMWNGDFGYSGHCGGGMFTPNSNWEGQN